MTHHGHLVERWLTVEEHEVSVLQVPLDDPPVLQEAVRAFVVSQVDAFSSVTHDVSGARVVIGTIPHQLLEIGDVVRCDCKI
jgi:hypothetical protein